jgi:hypothetical protein
MKSRVSCILAAVGVVAACAETGNTEPELLTAPAFSQHGGGNAASHEDARNFRAHATGDEEVPSNDSRAQGQAVFQLSKEGTALSYRLNVANIQNVTQAHIHCAPEGLNGSVALWLYPSTPPAQLIPGRSSGVLGAGVATGANIVPVADSAVCPGGIASLADLVEKIRTGGAYVNVHTAQFPPGEIRGQIF